MRAILAQAEMTVDNIVRVTSYLREPPTPRRTRRRASRRWAAGASRRRRSWSETLDARWLVEIELIAAA